MNRVLENRVALVTGASRGIGRAIATGLGRAGAHVIVNFYRHRDMAEETAGLIRSDGGGATVVGFDVCDGAKVQEAVAKIVGELGKIDILVNNAGISRDSLFVRTQEEHWRESMEVNLHGAFNCAKAVARPMMKGRYGRIVNISSVSAQLGTQGQAAYASAKAGLLGLTRCIARELAPRGITVNAVCPGYIETSMTAEISDQRKSFYQALIPLGRPGTPEEVAEAVLFLVGPGAGYITGQVLNVNGGLYM